MKLTFQKLIVDVHVRELGRAASFYRDALGFQLLHQARAWASFEVCGAEIHLYLHGGAEEGIEFRVLDLSNAVAILKSRGVQFSLDTHQVDVLGTKGDVMEFAWGKAAFFLDSEGNRLALVEDQL